jgi:hypothetical protein
LPLPRSNFSQYLTLLLSALLAFPSNLPTLERENAQADQESFCLATSCPGPGLHRLSRTASPYQEDLSILADEPEVPFGRDEFRYLPLALPHEPLDLPSLVPSALDSRPIGPIVAVASSSYTAPLRC